MKIYHTRKSFNIIGINPILVQIPPDTLTTMIHLLETYLPPLPHPIYIEIMAEPQFRTYFDQGATLLHEFDGATKLPNGVYNFHQSTLEKIHMICLIEGDTLLPTLMALLFQLTCAVFMGADYWDDAKNHYTTPEGRTTDPWITTQTLVLRRWGEKYPHQPLNRGDD